MEIAQHIYRIQVEKVAEALKEVTGERIWICRCPGLGMNIIGSKAAEILNLEVITMDEILSRKDCVVAPAVGTALLMEEFMKKSNSILLY